MATWQSSASIGGLSRCLLALNQFDRIAAAKVQGYEGCSEQHLGKGVCRGGQDRCCNCGPNNDKAPLVEHLCGSDKASISEQYLDDRDLQTKSYQGVGCMIRAIEYGLQLRLPGRLSGLGQD